MLSLVHKNGFCLKGTVAEVKKQTALWANSHLTIADLIKAKLQ